MATSCSDGLIVGGGRLRLMPADGRYRRANVVAPPVLACTVQQQLESSRSRSRSRSIAAAAVVVADGAIIRGARPRVCVRPS